MDMVQLKIEKDSSIAKYIKIIRAFDSSLSMGDIKKRIEENDFAVGFDLEYYDVLEDLGDIDRKKLFRDMIDELYKAGAQVSVYQNEELITIDELDNWLESMDGISRQVEADIDREYGQESV